MANRTIEALDRSNSGLFRARGEPKRAELRWEPRRYELSWGTQDFDGPHMVVRDPGGDYGVDLEVFFTTHRPIPELPDHYRKQATVRAVQVDEETRLVTEVKGRTEMTAKVPPGAWVIQNPDGELYYNSEEEFRKRYEKIEED